MRNQKGITLVELLAVIVIIGFLTLLIWRIFFQTIDSNSYAVTTQSLQQEANMILSTLQSLHTRDTIKVMYIESGQLYVETDATPDVVTKVKISGRSGVTYQLYSSPPTLSNGNVSGTFDPDNRYTSTIASGRVTLPVYLSLSANFKDGNETHYILNTTLSKLTTD